VRIDRSYLPYNGLCGSYSIKLDRTITSGLSTTQEVAHHSPIGFGYAVRLCSVPLLPAP